MSEREEFNRLIGDFSLDRALAGLGEIAAALPRIQDKLKILEAALSRVSIGDTDPGCLPEVSYGYIPLALTDFFDCLFDLEAALRADNDYQDPDLIHRRVDFVEAGCGSGRNAFLVSCTGRFEFGRIHGFDLSEALIEHGRRVFGLNDSLFVADCNSFDYSGYDVVYFYRPFSDFDAQTAFEDRLVGSLKPAAYVIGCGNLTFSDDRRLLAKCDHGRLFKRVR